MKTKKSWNDKLHDARLPQVKRLDKSFADMPEGCMMLIATPAIIDSYIRQIPKGKSVDLLTLRDDLAREYHAEKTCPLTTGIFLRIVAEAACAEGETIHNMPGGATPDQVYAALLVADQYGQRYLQEWE